MIRPAFQLAYDQFEQTLAKMKKASPEKREQNHFAGKMLMSMTLECFAQDCIGEDEQKLLEHIKKQTEEYFK